MARNRMLNPEFWLDEDIAKISAHARLLYMGLWGICDDNYATLPNKVGWIKAQIFPYEKINVNSLLQELESIGKIVKFQADNSEWWYIKNFKKHQKIDRPSNAKYPEYNASRIILDEPSTSTRSEVKGREVKGREVYSSAKADGTYTQEFLKFWERYPRKVGKQAAYLVWKRIKRPDIEIVLAAIEVQKNSDQWKENNGQYIPHPITWLRQGRWEDELQETGPIIHTY